MEWYQYQSVILQGLALAGALWQCMYISRNGAALPSVQSYVQLQACLGIWLGLDWLLKGLLWLQWFQPDIWWLLNSIVRKALLGLVGLGWWRFCRRYSGEGVSWNSLGPAAGVYALMLLDAYTSVLTRLSMLGLDFAYWLPYWLLYGYGLSGAWQLWQFSRRRSAAERWRCFLLSSSFLLPLLISMAQGSSGSLAVLIRPAPYWDWTPVGFLLGHACIAFAVVKFRLLDVVPIAAQTMLQTMQEALLVIDAQGRITEYNAAFATLIQAPVCLQKRQAAAACLDLFGRLLQPSAATQALLQALRQGCRATLVEAIAWKTPERYFQAQILPLYSESGEWLGQMLLLADVTQLTKMVAVLAEKNQQLENNAKLAAELAIARERNRLARDMHDTLGHTLTVVIALLEVGSVICRQEPAKTQQHLKEALGLARQGLQEVRQTVHGLLSERWQHGDAVTAVKEITQSFQGSGLQVEYTISGTPVLLPLRYLETLYRLLQEALTNSLRHGRAQEAAVVLDFGEQLSIYIFDNGRGCPSIVPGCGLRGMQERVAALAGTLNYRSDGESGFHVRVMLPLPESAREERE